MFGEKDQAMTLSDWLTHIEWLIGGMAGSCLAAFGGLYWVWDYARKSDAIIRNEGAESRERLRLELGRTDDKLANDLKGIADQMRAFQNEIYTRDDADNLERKLFARTDRIENKVDDISAKINQLIGRAGRGEPC
jgi:hypothetical protein